MSRTGYLREQATRNHGLKFYEKSHRYKLDGEWVPGVTTILGVLDKPGLRKWAAASVAEYVADNRDAVEHLYAAGRGPMVAALKETPWQQTRDAADRGTTFHDFAERIMNGDEVDVPEEQVPLVENALRFMEDYDIRPLLVEACVGSREHKYAGKGDLWADSKIGRAIFDWKSGKRIYPTFALQLAAYAFAEFASDGSGGPETPLPEVEAAYGVHIRMDGYDVVPLKFGRDVFDEFLTIRKAYDINKRCEGDWRKPGSGYAGVALHQDGVSA
jgi:hypothetical protein